MRDIGSCFSEQVVRISDSSCTNPLNQTCRPPKLILPSIQNAVTCLYKLTTSSQKQVNSITITITWCKTPIDQGLSITVGDDDPSSSQNHQTFKINTNSRIFRKKKGNKLFEAAGGSKIDAFWDLSTARYDSGPDPVDGFYVVIVVDSKYGLLLGDSIDEETITKKFKTSSISFTQFSLISRRECFSGNTHYSTKAQFCDNGAEHDILIRCGNEDESGYKYPVLSVCIDNKKVIRVKKLQWNFRGNQIIFVDGLLVDCMWDVHDWFFKPTSGYAVFMFRTRSVLDTRLWLQEKLHKQEDKIEEFSLSIYACKNQ
ncbi:hypothetical protein MKW94_022859 [Papaver nudicaule]|uniref:Uncharacterized protein n=1 Tax=Papaver nudicaule TaxID=74823 RepID=A0AA42AQK7_PAPNU|nr:hypothetical protein [Papaver nudicaule]